MSEHITVFCKFKIPHSLGIVSMDSAEPEIKSYIQKVIAEFEARNAEFISWSEFHGHDSNNENSDQESSSDATYVEIMMTIDENDLKKQQNQILTDKALEVLRGQTIQIVHSSRKGSECHIGFTQL